jgi:hypothetical protein
MGVEEEVPFVLSVFTSIKQRACLNVHALQEWVLRWIKPLTTSLVFETFDDLTRGTAELLAENARLAATTHYLVPTGQATCVEKDRPVSPSVLGRDGSNLEKCALPRPTRDGSRGFHRELFRLFTEAHIQGSGKQAKALA